MPSLPAAQSSVLGVLILISIKTTGPDSTPGLFVFLGFWLSHVSSRLPLVSHDSLAQPKTATVSRLRPHSWPSPQAVHTFDFQLWQLLRKLDSVPIAYLTTLCKCLISTLSGIYFAHNVFLLGCCSTRINGKTIHAIFQDKDLGVNFDSLIYYTPSIQKCGSFSSPSHRWHFPHLFLLLLSKTQPIPSSVWLAVPYPNALSLCLLWECSFHPVAQRNFFVKPWITPLLTDISRDFPSHRKRVPYPALAREELLSQPRCLSPAGSAHILSAFLALHAHSVWGLLADCSFSLIQTVILKPDSRYFLERPFLTRLSRYQSLWTTSSCTNFLHHMVLFLLHFFKSVLPGYRMGFVYTLFFVYRTFPCLVHARFIVWVHKINE